MAPIPVPRLNKSLHLLSLSGILVVLAWPCRASSNTGVIVQQLSLTVLFPSVMLTSQVVKSKQPTTGMTDISLMPSFSETHSAQTFTSTVTSSPRSTSGLLASHVSKYVAGHNTNLFSDSLQTETSVIVNSHLMQSLAGYVSSTLATRFTVAPSVHTQSSPSAMSVYSQTSFTSIHISPSKPSILVGNLTTDLSINSPFLSTLESSLHSSVHLKVSQTPLSQFSSVLQASVIHGSSSSTSPSALKHSPVLMVTTVSPSQSVTVSSMAKNTPTTSKTPSYSMAIKPPPATVTSVPALCKTGSCCTFGLSQLPPHLTFAESKARGMEN